GYASTLTPTHAAAQDLKQKPDPQDHCSRYVHQPREESERYQGENLCPRIKQYIRTEDAGNGSAGPDRGDYRVDIRCDMGQRSEDATDQVEDRIPNVPHCLFDVIAEDPEEEHVADQVHETAVQENARQDAGRRRYDGDLARKRAVPRDQCRN